MSDATFAVGDRSIGEIGLKVIGQGSQLDSNLDFDFNF